MPFQAQELKKFDESDEDIIDQKVDQGGDKVEGQVKVHGC